jgi:DNA-binding transcriptional MerR regulator/methylmalonyl-CoA mutase cobalamin-binding subunit
MPDNPASMEQIPIRTVAALTGVNAITLRAWERRYGFLRPLRTAKGHRLYTHRHVEEIRRVLAFIERGVPISRVRELLEAEPTAFAEAHAHGPWSKYLDRMTSAIARFDEPELDRAYDEALSIHSGDEVTRCLILPLLLHLGERWTLLDGAVAEEHFFATYLRSKLGARLQHRMRYANGPRLLAACAPGEQHEIGLMLFALEAQLAGMRTVLLGADTPLEEIAIAQRRSGSDAVVISSSVDPAPQFLGRELPNLVRQTMVPVFVGGTTAARHRRAIAAAGATPLNVEIEDGVRLIQTTLSQRRTQR